MAPPQDTRAAAGAHGVFPVGFLAGTATASAGEDAPVEPPQDCAQLQPHFVDPIQERYELIRPLVLFGDGTATQRARDTHTHPETIGTLKRRFEPRGMLGLLPATLEVRPATRRPRVSPAVVAELARLKALYTGFHYRELARILFYTVGERVDHKTVKTLWLQSPAPAPAPLPLLAPAQGPARPQVRLQAVQLYAQGWRKISISRFLHVSRPTLDTWMRRFEAEHLAGLADKSSAPKSPARKTWLPLMVAIYHLQKRHPDAGRFRIWSLLARPDISERTVGRVMALNKQVYPDIPHVRRRRDKQPPAPHPYKATAAHHYWFIDGRKMDVAVEGIRWWSIILLEGYSRTILAGVLAPTEATWATLMVLHTACRHYGAPTYLVSDSGGAYTSEAFEAVCTRLAIDHKTIVSTHGESYLNWMETHFNVQRRLYDYQFAGARTATELEQLHQVFIQTYNTTAHQGLLKDRRLPPIPMAILGAARGRLYTEAALADKFAQTVFARTTNRYGCVTLHRSHFYVEDGVPHTPVLLWVAGEQLRAVLDNVVLAEYPCQYNASQHTVTALGDGVFYPTRFASPQGTLLPREVQRTIVVYAPRRPRQAPPRPAAQQLGLFVDGRTA